MEKVEKQSTMEQNAAFDVEWNASGIAKDIMEFYEENGYEETIKLIQDLIKGHEIFNNGLKKCQERKLKIDMDKLLSNEV